MNIAVVGLGLIGGSMAGAIKSNTNYTVYGFDKDNSVNEKALQTGIIDFILNESNLPVCDIVISAIYPNATIQYISDNLKYIKKGSVILDCCGVKETVCNCIWENVKNTSITFVGGHPMAGKQFSGLEHASPNLFRDSSMILVPENDDVNLDILINLFLSIGFSHINVTTPKEHDRIIAFTSQLAHVVSNAYIKSPQAENHKGFSAGSYRDLTRVARLNPSMWTELFLENADNLSFEIDTIIKNLEQINNAIKKKDAVLLYNLLNEGSEIKKRVDG